MPDYPVTPHLRVPFAINGSRASAVEQDTVDEIEQCVQAIIRTPIGELLDEPELGIPDYLFTQSNDDAVDEITEAVSEWEPRASVSVVEDAVEETYERFLTTNIDTRED